MKYIIVSLFTLFLSSVDAKDLCILIDAESENGCPIIPYYRSERLSIAPQILIDTNKIELFESDMMRVDDVIYAVFYGIYGDIIAVSEGDTVSEGS